MSDSKEDTGQFIALSSDEEGEISSPRSTTDVNVVSPEELNQLRKYYPFAKDPSNICLSCGHEGHRTASCDWVPETDPDVSRWCSYRPDPNNVKKVVSLNVSCSMCASREHYERDCPWSLPPGQEPPTTKVQDRYVDPGCGVLSIEDAARDASAAKPDAGGPAGQIRGRPAASNNVVHYSESEDSDVGLVGPKPSRRPEPRPMRVATNLQLPRMPPASVSFGKKGHHGSTTSSRAPSPRGGGFRNLKGLQSLPPRPPGGPPNADNYHGPPRESQSFGPGGGGHRGRGGGGRGRGRGRVGGGGRGGRGRGRG